MNNDWIYDCETYPNCFTIGFEHSGFPLCYMFEISDYRNEAAQLLNFLSHLRESKARMVGFNNLGFDYPILHLFLKMNGQVTAKVLYDKAQSIIESGESSRFSHLVYPSDRVIEQLDLYKIHHFDNKARATGLKALEFTMRSDSIQDLPFPVGATLNEEQIRLLKAYNKHDISETKKFYHHTLPMIKFREELTAKYQRDFMNHNDTKIGKDYFIMRLEDAGVPCYEYGPSGRQPRQTKRPQLVLRDAILPWIKFDHPEFTRVLGWLKSQTITETKGVFKDLTATLKRDGYGLVRDVALMEQEKSRQKRNATVGGFEFVFGTGGIHGSVKNRVIESDNEYVIVDLDVKSFYPNLAIANGFYPEHLGKEFCAIYKYLYDQRSKYAKDSAENAMLKLALNGVYGDSNNPFSVFYDPLFTMKITLNGQLLLCLLAEKLMSYGCDMIQVNTDGLTVRLEKSWMNDLETVCEEWQADTGLTLEQKNYKRMFIRDVNNYGAEYEDGSVKRKGAYEYKVGWHQDHSMLVVPKVAEKVLLHDAPIRETIENWPDIMDFMICAKVPRSSYLTQSINGGEVQIQNTCRYLVAKAGVELNKWMPPLKNKTEWRKIGICKGRKVMVMNELPKNLEDFKSLIDYGYYINEVEKLVMELS